MGTWLKNICSPNENDHTLVQETTGSELLNAPDQSNICTMNWMFKSKHKFDCLCHNLHLSQETSILVALYLFSTHTFVIVTDAAV